MTADPAARSTPEAATSAGQATNTKGASVVTNDRSIDYENPTPAQAAEMDDAIAAARNALFSKEALAEVPATPAADGHPGGFWWEGYGLPVEEREPFAEAWGGKPPPASYGYKEWLAEGQDREGGDREAGQ